jgi:hypothetical protein
MTDYPVELPHGFYHRRVVAIVEPGRVRAAVEDESHCMEVSVFHDGTRVTDIEATSSRIPWSSCPNAGIKLKDLIGVPLQRMHETTGRDAKLHCTHLFDLARVAIARAKAGASVQYDIAVEDRVERRTRGELIRDGQFVMAWDVVHITVTGPDPFTGHLLVGAPQWPPGLDDDTLEAALVLRRVFLVAQMREPKASVARTHGPPQVLDADVLTKNGMLGRCYSYRVETGAGARSLNSWRDFAGAREKLLEQFPGTRSIAEMQRVRG